MPPDTPTRSTRRPLDEVALARVYQRLQSADAAPWLHAEVARRMAERLAVIRLQPERMVDWGAHLGASRQLLQKSYPKALWQPVEAEGAGQALTSPPEAAWWQRLWGRAAAQPVLDAAALPAGRAQLVWSNMGLHGSIDPQQLMRRWHRALAIESFVMFSTLGPGSLQRLRQLYRSAGWPVPYAPFVDMHDLGDMLIEAGFADPVMDQETITLSWASGEALLDELRQLGGNVDPRRFAGLRTPRWRASLLAQLQAGADSAGRVALDFEIVYGHAFKPAPRPRLAAETAVPLDDLRAMVRAGRRGP